MPVGLRLGLLPTLPLPLGLGLGDPGADAPALALAVSGAGVGDPVGVRDAGGSHRPPPPPKKRDKQAPVSLLACCNAGWRHHTWHAQGNPGEDEHT